MERKRFIYGFAHYRTDIGDGVRTGIYFGDCPGGCNEACMNFKRIKEHNFVDDTKEKYLYSADELVEYLREEKMLFSSKTLGISFLGREPLSDIDFCLKTALGIRKLNMTLQIATCGSCDPYYYSAIKDWCELLYFRMFAPIPGIRPPVPGYSFERVWDNLLFLERKKIPYRLLIPVIRGMNTNTAEGFSAVASSMRSMKSVVLDFSYSGFSETEIYKFKKEFYRRNLTLY